MFNIPAVIIINILLHWRVDLRSRDQECQSALSPTFCRSGNDTGTFETYPMCNYLPFSGGCPEGPVSASMPGRVRVPDAAVLPLQVCPRSHKKHVLLLCQLTVAQSSFPYRRK